VADDGAELVAQVQVHLRRVMGPHARRRVVVAREEAEHLDRRVVELDLVLGRVVRRVGERHAGREIDDVRRGVLDGADHEEREGLARIDARGARGVRQPRLEAGERARLLRHRDLFPRLHARPDEEWRLRVALDGDAHALVVDPRDEGRSVPDEDLAAQPRERTDRIEVVELQQRLERDARRRLAGVEHLLHRAEVLDARRRAQLGRRSAVARARDARGRDRDAARETPSDAAQARPSSTSRAGSRASS
jgi:hypothetical protein